MKVLVVARSRNGDLSPFVTEQVAAIRGLGVSIETMAVGAGGARGYAAFYTALLRRVRESRYDIVHAHYGLTGLVATLQRAAPTVITFHGSDINQTKTLRLSRLAAKRAAASIVVSERLSAIAAFSPSPFVIPCGVDPVSFYAEDYESARASLGFGPEPVVLFGGSRNRAVKNYPLAAAAVAHLGTFVRLVELDGLSRDGVRRMLSSVDALLLTSLSEGSPQIVKEALMTGCPVVSTDVGDVRDLLKDVPLCHVTEPAMHAIAAALKDVLQQRQRVPRLARFEALSNEVSARKVLGVYEGVLQTCKAAQLPASWSLVDGHRRGRSS
jgi:teichuronic acid biosynthesis glycosyltransferase TuaC